MSQQDTSCTVCGFELWNPIYQTKYSTLALYNDARFKGRSILRLDKHYDNLEDVDDVLLGEYITEVKQAVTILKTVTGAARVNVSFLGNSVAHVHGHLIPRYPEDETYPGKSPWNDPRPLTQLPSEEVQHLVSAIQNEYLNS